ncbi:hypothetical protein F2P79_020840 [Pimephales promelas]|nr:hypothetical protein F2P79_020840 [Pimephales promelas]
MANQEFKRCVIPCPRFITGGDTHQFCVACLGVEHAQSVLEGADCEHCVKLSMRTLRSRRFGSRSSRCGSCCRRGTASTCILGFAKGSGSGPLPAGSSASAQGGARSADSPSRAEAPMLTLSSSEELDVVSVDAGDHDVSSAHPPGDEELLALAFVTSCS